MARKTVCVPRGLFGSYLLLYRAGLGPVTRWSRWNALDSCLSNVLPYLTLPTPVGKVSSALPPHDLRELPFAVTLGGELVLNCFFFYARFRRLLIACAGIFLFIVVRWMGTV